ncbi:hypothetical protein C1645_842746 [Glomus cerebriforme]|uniref:Uncharacterized protein n=1 Tax=Glomus cerebriforme TaxID=658196 RepID=A0A397S2Q9_9GLOM|nr:hypothetical protein C1645_842746 [Glomus cerebriforme]
MTNEKWEEFTLQMDRIYEEYFKAHSQSIDLKSINIIWDLIRKIIIDTAKSIIPYEKIKVKEYYKKKHNIHLEKDIHFISKTLSCLKNFNQTKMKIQEKTEMINKRVTNIVQQNELDEDMDIE